MRRKVGYLWFKNVTYPIKPMVSVLEGYHSFILSFAVSINWFEVII
jgi:hypothetical protein